MDHLRTKYYIPDEGGVISIAQVAGRQGVGTVVELHCRAQHSTCVRTRASTQEKILSTHTARKLFVAGDSDCDSDSNTESSSDSNHNSNIPVLTVATAQRTSALHSVAHWFQVVAGTNWLIFRDRLAPTVLVISTRLVGS